MNRSKVKIVENIKEDIIAPARRPQTSVFRQSRLGNPRLRNPRQGKQDGTPPPGGPWMARGWPTYGRYLSGVVAWQAGWGGGRTSQVRTPHWWSQVWGKTGHVKIRPHPQNDVTINNKKDNNDNDNNNDNNNYEGNHIKIT